MIPNSTPSATIPVSHKGANSKKRVPVLPETNVGAPGGKFSLGIPKNQISEDDPESTEASTSPRQENTFHEIAHVSNHSSDTDCSTPAYSDSDSDYDNYESHGERSRQDASPTHPEKTSWTRLRSVKIGNDDTHQPHANNSVVQPRTAVWRQGTLLSKRGEICIPAGVILGSIAIMAWMSYQTAIRPKPFSWEPNPDFNSSVSHAFEKCAQALGFESNDQRLIESFTYLLRDSYSKALSHIDDVGGLLECDPGKLTKDLGSIYRSYDHQMEAMKNASAGVLSPNACLILFSLVALLMQMGMI
ncbi:hypothetical protein H6CHR_05207 [Variovorax sp. PBL-H6]|uniref:hypothetical protein n=1 Tax=Variovorax sp. PBL-H6 TaxID=434009 RepID=UPI001317924F|nr:hypothetical protein [Variovorax sp. PBL-H6]VTU38385.1 hypothetical protein H6CHR_05207 [Variovorax sp. PBL-H6]